jgi:DNA-binding GntR family transcriptional regulator
MPESAQPTARPSAKAAKPGSVARRRRSAPEPTAPRSKPETRSGSILLAIERDILSGARRPGDHLNEQEIADRFKVSRTPVREAMRQLAAAGLVQISPRKGAFVARVSAKRLLELFEVMTEIEALCAGLAAKRAKAHQRRAMEQLHLRTEGLTHSAADAEAYFEVSSGLHRLIFQATQNSALADLANQYYTRLLPYRRRQLGATRRPNRSFEEHDEVLRAILAGDAAAAADAMRRHSGMVTGNVLDVFSALLDE